jgi:putative DNA primase/helicase
MKEASGALVSRLLALKTTRTWLDKEDMGLAQRLLAELPGVLNWAIAGWQRVQRSGRFTQAGAGKERLRAMEELSNPVGEFLRERCEIGPAYVVPTQELYRAWRWWCDAHGLKPTPAHVFGNELRTAVPTVEKSRLRTLAQGRAAWAYCGVRLRRWHALQVRRGRSRRAFATDPRSSADFPRRSRRSRLLQRSFLGR